VTSRARTFILAAIVSTVATSLACGGGGSTTGPSPVTGSPGPSGATITINANGVVSPSTVTINVGESVTFINNHSAAHEMASDPHPAHTDCPQINALGVLQPGQTKLTNALTTARSCGFHDHRNDTNANLRGTITAR
jgi:plastocyanin